MYHHKNFDWRFQLEFDTRPIIGKIQFVDLEAEISGFGVFYDKSLPAAPYT